MGYVIFRGVSTKDIGVLVEKMPAHAKPPVRHTEYQIPGRDGMVHTEEGYAPFDLPITLTMFRNDAFTRDKINAWADGTGQLVTSDMLSRCWHASVLRGVKYTRRKYGDMYYDTAQVTFRCQPVMREVMPTVMTYTQSGVMVNLGNVETQPKIVVVGNGDCTFTVGGQQVTLAGVTDAVTLDCEAGYVYTASGAVEMVGEFPRIPMGESDVILGGGVEKLEITPNWGWL